jgi:GntR family transcriptional regulator
MTVLGCSAPCRDRNRWRPIANELRHRIAVGHYVPGERLPTNAELRERHGVSGQTVQHAINALRNEGLVITRPGLGWYVRKSPEVVRLVRRPEPLHHERGHFTTSSPIFFGSETADWVPEVRTVLRFTRPTAGVAADLRISQDSEILARERTMTEGGEVLALATSYFSRSLTRGTVIESEDTGPGGVFACLHQLGYRVSRHVERVTSGSMEDEEAVRFGRIDRPIVFRIARATISGHVVLGVIHIVALAERFELCYELPTTGA